VWDRHIEKVKPIAHGSAYLRLNKPLILPASSVVVLEQVGGVDGDAVVSVVQRSKLVPVGAHMEQVSGSPCAARFMWTCGHKELRVHHFIKKCISLQ